MNMLVADERKSLKKSTLKKLRNDGIIPAIVYGNDIDTVSISIKKADLLKVIKNAGRNGVLSLNLDEKSKNVILRDYQSDPVTNEILHVDFLQAH